MREAQVEAGQSKRLFDIFNEIAPTVMLREKKTVFWEQNIFAIFILIYFLFSTSISQ